MYTTFCRDLLRACPGRVFVGESGIGRLEPFRNISFRFICWEVSVETLAGSFRMRFRNECWNCGVVRVLLSIAADVRLLALNLAQRQGIILHVVQVFVVGLTWVAGRRSDGLLCAQVPQDHDVVMSRGYI